ncbi:hypothetical protein [Paraburkholderia sp.]|uniref:hypothetical protein n=1 Tax=Paraburkholderia sp. TaxID=1926495 RepID=UPI003C7A1BED
MQRVTLAAPQQPAHAVYGRFDTSDKTVGEVVAHLERQLRAAEIEPEWIDVANFTGDECQALYGVDPLAPWPERGSARNRLVISVSRGSSEGWTIQIDHVEFNQSSPLTGHWTSVPLIRAKSLSRTDAWTAASAIARMLDID